MVNGQEFVNIFKGLCSAYGKRYDERQCSIYWQALKEFTKEDISHAFGKCIKIVERFPSAATIMSALPKDYHQGAKALSGPKENIPSREQGRKYIQEMLKDIANKKQMGE